MKYLFLLLLSFNTFAITPPAKSFLGEIYGYPIAIYLTTYSENVEYGITAVYKNNDEWIFLWEPYVYTVGGETEEQLDNKFNAAIVEINGAIQDKLAPITQIPSNGGERLTWLIENKLKVQNNQLVFVQ